MGLLVECPKCKTRNSPKNNQCKCGVHLKKLGHKNYWIEYYNDRDERKRERIGPSKDAAEQRLRSILKARTEGRHIDVDKTSKLNLTQLIEWYLQLPEVKSKASYERDRKSAKNLLRILGSLLKVRELNAGLLESYQHVRLSEPSPKCIGQKISPATVNREIACLKTAFSKALKYNLIKTDPLIGLKLLPENNVREELLSQDQFHRLLDECPEHIRPIVLVAYYTGMRKSELLNLTWNEVDIEQGFIRLKAEQTKTRTRRSIPMHPSVCSLLKTIPRAIHIPNVFLLNGKPIREIKNGFKSACKRAGLDNFTFHDLRHCAINNLRLAGNDYFKIMSMSGHKTTNVFKRYNTVTEMELQTMTWPEEHSDQGSIDTYMDT